MARFAFTLLTLLAARLAAAGPVALDNSTLLANGQQAQVLNAEFQTLNKTDSCEDGQIACIKGDIANCAEGTWQTQACSSGKSCFALPQVRSEGIFVACTSENNAASIIGSTGAQGGNASNSTFGKEVPFPTANSTDTSDDSNDNDNDGDCTDGDDDNGKDDNGKDQGDDNGDDDSSDEQTVTVTVTLPASGSTTLPPTTTTLSPSQASVVISAISAAAPSASPAAAGDNNNQQSNAGAAPPVIHLTPAPLSSPAAATATPAPSSSAIVAAAAAAAPADAGYSY